MRSVRRWWRYNDIKLKIFSVKILKTTRKILRIKRLDQIKFSENLNSKKLFFSIKPLKSCGPTICIKSSKFKKSFNLFRVNRWTFLKESEKNNLPNIKKYVW